jgi:hypothetical protein
MSTTSIRALGTALAMALMLAWGAPASAQQAKCLAGKTKCLSKKGTGLLKCHALSETPGKTPDPNALGCMDKVVTKYDGGLEPAKGCFEKLENKPGNDCITHNDTGSAEDAIDSCVNAFVTTIDQPPLTQSKCDAGKKKCVSKYLKALLKCRQLAQTPGKSNDPNAGGCVDKAKTKYNGGIDPTKGCFAKLEAKNPNDCQVPGDSGALQTLVENCDDDLADLLTNTTTTTTTTTTTSSTTTTLGCTPSGTIAKGALTPTLGRFNYNLTLGLPGANAACNSNFPGTHACSIQELQAAEALCDLRGLVDTASNPVTSFWAIDATAAALQQCNDDAVGGSGLNWEYGTAHTASRGERVLLNNGTGALGIVMMSQQCNISGMSNVGCCQ